MPVRRRHAPRHCPVCGEVLALTRLSCDACSTELSGSFHACEYCSLGDDDREVLRLFLGARGNMKELERRLGVSYPTARSRLDGLLARLGLQAAAPPQAAVPIDLLESLARGDIDVEQALEQLE